MVDLSKKPLEAARDAVWDVMEEARYGDGGLSSEDMARAAITAYLSALPADAEVVEMVRQLRACAACYGVLGVATLLEAATLLERLAARTEGWQMVPVEPTPEMCEAGMGFVPGDDPSYCYEAGKRFYAAMLKAAPPAPRPVVKT